jgi:hypothetical protein
MKVCKAADKIFGKEISTHRIFYLLGLAVVCVSTSVGAAEENYYPPKSLTEPRCYSIVGQPLAVIYDHLGSA